MLLVLLLVLVQLRASSAILYTTENRVSTRNITCLNGSSSTGLQFYCEACLVLVRNYEIRTSLSLTGAGPLGITYQCLHTNEVEVYHENLVRECQNFPRGSLNGYDDFCIASPFNQLRGSYRACLCISNACNFNYTQCVQHGQQYWNRAPSIFSNTIAQLTDRVKCYRPYEDYKQPTYSSLKPLCASNDDECKNFLFDHGVLCAISVDRVNQIVRQTLPPSIYLSYIMKYKTELCKLFTWTSKSIYFTKCQQDETVCMCAVDGCDKDLETCRRSKATSIYLYYRSHLEYACFCFLLLISNIYS